MYYWNIKMYSASGIIRHYDFFGNCAEVIQECNRIMEKSKGYFVKYEYDIVTTLH